jgi:hypothetical protein
MRDLLLKKEYIDDIRKTMRYIKKDLVNSLINTEESGGDPLSIKRLKWMITLAEKTEERLKFLGHLNIFSKFRSIHSTQAEGIFADQFNYKVNEIPKNFNKFKDLMERTSIRNGYFEQLVYDLKETVKEYYRGSKLSEGPFTTNIDHQYYKEDLYPKIKAGKEQIFKVKESPDNDILKEIMNIADPSYSKIPKNLITKYQGQPHHFPLGSGY